MNLPNTFTKHGNQYKFLKEYATFALYENIKTKIKECFLKHDLKQKK